MRNLHRITGAIYHHTHPECPRCEHRADTNDPTFPFYCVARRKTLCCDKPRACRYFAATPATTQTSEEG